MTSSSEVATRLQDIFAAQHNYRWTAKASTANERIEHLLRFREALGSRVEAVVQALHADLLYPAARARAHVEIVQEDIDLTVAHLAEWMQPTRMEPNATIGASEAYIQYEARGVCLVFGPWNYPFLLVFQPLVAVLAAGNTAIVKPNELAPATSAVMAEIIEEVFPEELVAVVEGGVDVAEAMLELRVDHIFFTGSPGVGRIVMTAAARHLATVTLELGGKCPAIVDGTVDLRTAAAQIAEAKHRNAGQICLAPDHVWVHEAVKDEFVSAYVEWVQDNTDANGEMNAALFGKIVNQRNVDRLSGYVTDAVERGASVLLGGTPRDEVFPPTVLLDVPLEAAVMHDEIFGPIMPVLPYRSNDQIVDFVRAGGKPLAMYIYSEDSATIADLLERTSSGGVTIRGWALHYLDERLPFGGVGTSGMGRYHGVHGFRELSHARSVVTETH